MPVQDGLQPKADVPDGDRTEGKDDAFEQLEALREQGELYGRPMTALEKEIGWSRQHISNVLEDYYQAPKDAPALPGASWGDDGRHVRLDVEIPDDVEDAEAFLRGYIQGLMDEM